MSANGKTNAVLDPEAPGLDEETRRRRRVLARLHELPVEELFKLVATMPPASAARSYLLQRLPE